MCNKHKKENVQPIPEVLLVDQREIPGSYGCVSLFLKGTHIYDFDDLVNVSYDDIAASLASALDVEVETIEITTKQLAQCIAGRLEEDFDEGDVESHEQLLHGYTNADLLYAILRIHKWNL